MEKLCLILGLISLVLSSCGLNQAVPPEVTATPTEMETSTSTPGATLTPSLTALPIATITPFPTTQATTTELPKVLPTNTPRADNEPVLIASFGKTDPLVHSKIVFNPDGIIIAQAASSVKLWDVRTHELIRELEYPYSEKIQPEKILFSPDSSLLAVSLSDHSNSYSDPIGHLLVWEVSSGDLLQDWTQECAIMIDPNHGPYHIPVYAMAFLPNSTKLAYANGNNIEIKDVREESEMVVVSLGTEMFASEISIRYDAEFMYVLMDWYFDNPFSVFNGWRSRIQIWHMNTLTLRRELKYPKNDFHYESMYLVGVNALHENEENATIEVQNLTTDKMGNYPYRKGLKYYNSDTSLMVCFRDGSYYEDGYAIEIWNTDNWRNIFTFKPSFLKYGNYYYLSDIAISPENTILAMYYKGEVYLWDIRSVDYGEEK